MKSSGLIFCSLFILNILDCLTGWYKAKMFIPIDVGVSIYLGWLTLSLLIINEARSIVENLIESNVKVPKWLSNSLEVYQNSVESIVKKEK